MSGKKSPYPDGRIPDRNPDGTPAVPWRNRWTEGVLPLWLVATQAAWLFSSLWVCSSTVPTPALVLLEKAPQSKRNSNRLKGRFFCD